MEEVEIKELREEKMLYVTADVISYCFCCDNTRGVTSSLLLAV